MVGCCHTDFLLLRPGIRLSDCSRQLQSVQQQRIQVVDVESQTDLPLEYWWLMALPVQMMFTTSHPWSVFLKYVNVCPGIILTCRATLCLPYLLFWGLFAPPAVTVILLFWLCFTLTDIDTWFASDTLLNKVLSGVQWQTLLVPTISKTVGAHCHFKRAGQYKCIQLQCDCRI